MAHIGSREHFGIDTDGADWDERSKAVLVPVSSDARQLTCVITRGAIRALLEHEMGRKEYLEAMRRYAERLAAICAAKIESGDVAADDAVTIEWNDVLPAQSPASALEPPARPASAP